MVAVEPLASNSLPPFEKVSLMLEVDFHWTGPAPPWQVSLMLYPWVMVVTLGVEHFWFGVPDCQVWPALFAQTVA